eukprot:2859712-Pyramimonas_sp.AAC.1
MYDNSRRGPRRGPGSLDPPRRALEGTLVWPSRRGPRGDPGSLDPSRKGLRMNPKGLVLGILAYQHKN